MSTAKLFLAAAGAILAIGAAACGTRTMVQPTAASRSFDPTCAAGVAVYQSFNEVPYDYYEVAFITTEQNAVYTSSSDAVKAMQARAGEQGGNGVVVNSLGASKATVKRLGAALGASDADRQGRAVAIFMPADSLRVKNACGKA